jgi:hypothetical protein
MALMGLVMAWQHSGGTFDSKFKDLGFKSLHWHRKIENVKKANVVERCLTPGTVVERSLLVIVLSNQTLSVERRFLNVVVDECFSRRRSQRRFESVVVVAARRGRLGSAEAQRRRGWLRPEGDGRRSEMRVPVSHFFDDTVVDLVLFERML